MKKDGKLVFSTTNAKLAALALGTVLYSEKNVQLPLGLVAKVSSVSTGPLGTMEIETIPATLADAFAEYHIFIDNRPVYFLPNESGSDQPAATRRPVSPVRPQAAASDSVGGLLRADYLEDAVYVEGVHPEAASQGTWTTNLSFDKKLLNESCCTLEVNAGLTLSLTGEVNLNYSFPYTSFSGEVLFTPVLTGNATATATLTVGITQDDIPLLPSVNGSFPVGGIPVTVSADLVGGFGITGSISATISGDATVRATGGFGWDLGLFSSNSAALIPCPNPCPNGFSCGPSYSGGPTCSLTATGSASFSTDNSAYVYVEPKVGLGPGISVAGFSVDAEATVGIKYQLEAKIEPPNLNVYAELIPNIGADLTFGLWTWTPVVVNLAELSTKVWSLSLAAPAPSITGLSPSSYPASGSSQAMLINGNNFKSGATLTFHDPQGNPYAGRATTFISSNQLSHPFNNGNNAGPWTVFVTNPDGHTSNTWNFTVTVASATITVQANPSNGGTVSGGGSYTVGSQRQISASAYSGWTFTGWSDGNTQNPRTITVPSGGATYTANFQQSTATVTVQANPSNGGTVSGGGTYAIGSQQQISAAPNSGWTFTGWNDGNTQNPRTVTVPSGGATYTATFQQSTAVKAAMVSPTPGSVLPGASVTFTWTAGTGVSTTYLWVGTTPGGVDLVNFGGGTATSYTATLPTNGSSIYVRLWSVIGGGLQYTDYTYTEATAAVKAAMVSPTPGSVLPGASVTFTWTAGTNVSTTYLWVGTRPGGAGLVNFGGGAATSYTATLPTTGASIYVRLWSLIGGVLQYTDYTYTEATAAVKAAMVSPTPGSVLSGNPVTFTWTAGTGVSTTYLWVGTTPGGADLVDFGGGAATSYTATLPTTGSIYVRLWSLIDGVLQYTDYTYTG